MRSRFFDTEKQMETWENSEKFPQKPDQNIVGYWIVAALSGAKTGKASVIQRVT
jgi:hypothetical protein